MKGELTRPSEGEDLSMLTEQELSLGSAGQARSVFILQLITTVLTISQYCSYMYR